MEMDTVNSVIPVSYTHLYLVNLDRVIEYFTGPELKSEKKPEQEKKLEPRRLKVRRMMVG